MIILMNVLKTLGYIILGLLGLIFFGVALLLISGLFVNPNKEYDKNSRYYRFLLYMGTWFALVFGRIHVKATGLDKVPNTRFLYVSNHRSNFDPIIAWYMLKDKDVAFISKEKNFHVPAFGRIIRKCCFMAIDRENPRNAIKTIEKAANLIKADEVSVGVYPEGTRSKECKLLPFHNGVFKIAQKANVPIVVGTISGTESIHKNFPLKQSKVEFKILEVLAPEEIVDKPSNLVGDRVLEIMRKELESTNE